MTRSAALSWAALVALTVVLTAALRLLHVPAALMLGPMLSAITVAIALPGAKLPSGAAVVAQAVLGCLIAHALSPHLLADLASRWPLLLGMNLLVILGIAGLGLIVTRLQWLPGTAGIWGMSPGGAGAMVMLAEAYGGDKRVVAVMQYLRLLVAALGVIAIGSLLGQPHVSSGTLSLPGAPGVAWLPPLHLPSLAVTGVLAAAAVWLSMRLRKPVLVIFLPVFGGIAVQVVGGPAPDVPPLLSADAFALIGWHIGLSFTRASLLHSARLIPRILAGIIAILILCTVLSWCMAEVAHVSFLTAYMSLNPGGMDAVMVMAASISVDLPLILAMQISRLILVIGLAPVLGRIASAWHLKSAGPPDSPVDDPAGRLAKDVDAVL